MNQHPSPSASDRVRAPARAGLFARALAVPIRVYRYLISPMLPPRCRFYPSCSAYALEALSWHGALRGGLLAAKRVCRCHPWNPGGVDLVPESPSLLRAGTGRWPDALRSEPSVKAD